MTAPATGRTAEDEMEAEIGFAFARYLSASDLDVSLRRRVRAAVEPILEDLMAARKERDEAQRQVSEAILEVDPPLKDGVWCGTLTEAIAATNEALDDAEAEAAHLRAENASLRDRVREAEGAGWSTDWPAAAQHKGDILAGAYSSQGGWRQAVVGYAGSIFWDWPFGEKPTHWRHLDKPPALSPEPQEAGDHEPR